MSGQDAKHNEVRVTGTTGKGASPRRMRGVFFYQWKGGGSAGKAGNFQALEGNHTNYKGVKT